MPGIVCLDEVEHVFVRLPTVDISAMTYLENRTRFVTLRVCSIHWYCLHIWKCLRSLTVCTQLCWCVAFQLHIWHNKVVNVPLHLCQFRRWQHPIQLAISDQIYTGPRIHMARPPPLVHPENGVQKLYYMNSASLSHNFSGRSNEQRTTDSSPFLSVVHIFSNTELGRLAIVVAADRLRSATLTFSRSSCSFEVGTPNWSRGHYIQKQK